MGKKLKEKYNEKQKNYCKVCNKTIIGNTHKFQCHLFRHRLVEPRYQCRYCPKEHFRRDLFVRHVASHHDKKFHKKEFICDYCGQSYAAKISIIKHLKIHDDCHIDLDVNKCRICDVKFSEERSLKHHIRQAHYNLKPIHPIHFSKSLNETWVETVNKSKAFVQITKVKKNMLSMKRCTETVLNTTQIDRVNDFNSYVCSVLMSENKGQYLKVICDYCNKEMLKKSIILHIQSKHLKIRRFKCDICKCTFQRRYQLTNHVCGKFKAKKKLTT